MNEELFAEWFRRRGHSVVKTPSSYWCSLGPRVFQAIPFCWTINPTESELRYILFRHAGIGLRYSAPATFRKGVVSYNVICDSSAYDIGSLPRSTRQNVKKGLAHCAIAPISFARLAIDGWHLHLDTLRRQNRRDFLTKETWERSCHAAEDLPGFEAWGALLGGKLAAVILLVRVNDWIILLSQQSLTACLHAKPNHALVYRLTKDLLARENTRAIFYSLKSLDAPARVDDFKFRMGYRKIAVKQCVLFHPLVSPLINDHTLSGLQGFQRRYPSNPWLAKAEGLVRLSVKGDNAEAMIGRPSQL